MGQVGFFPENPQQKLGTDWPKAEGAEGDFQSQGVRGRTPEILPASGRSATFVRSASELVPERAVTASPNKRFSLHNYFHRHTAGNHAPSATCPGRSVSPVLFNPSISLKKTNLPHTLVLDWLRVFTGSSLDLVSKPAPPSRSCTRPATAASVANRHWPHVTPEA